MRTIQVNEVIFVVVTALLTLAGCGRDTTPGAAVSSSAHPIHGLAASGVENVATTNPISIIAESGVAASGISPADGGRLPPTLASFLQQNRSYHLLTADDISDSYTKEAFSSHESEAIREADTTGSRRNDIVAVVVKDNLFSVVVLQTTPDGKSAKVEWLVRDSSDTIAGVFVNGKYIVPAFCLGCDTLTSYAWTGSEYGANVILKGDAVCLEQSSVLYSSADVQSKPVYTTTKTGNATVLEVGARSGEAFWHKIRLATGETGFVLNSAFNFEPGDC